MLLTQVIVILVVVGLLLWLVNAYIPMAAPIKRIVNVVVLIAVVLWLLNLFGVFGVINSGLKAGAL